MRVLSVEFGEMNIIILPDTGDVKEFVANEIENAVPELENGDELQITIKAEEMSEEEFESLPEWEP